jgi:hypothetical protein
MAIIDKPDLYFNTKLYTGNNNTTQTISGVGFQPDLVWIKNRDNVENHYLFDAVRGSGKILKSSYSNAEADLPTNTKPTIASDGFTLTSNGSNDELNFGTRTYVSWSWLAGGTASSNTDGSITSSVSANTTSGFSIVSWTGTGSAGTIGHSLGTNPSMIITKSRSAAGNWYVYHATQGATKFFQLQATDAVATNSTVWNNTEPTSSVFSTGTAFDNETTYIAYCFAEKQGYSKFSSYVGNGNVDGPFCFTGFKPAFLLIKQSGAVGKWLMIDNKRDPDNACNHRLNADVDNAESTGGIFVDMLSNGWKFRTTDDDYNTSGVAGIYMAIAENPFVSSTGLPATAR